MNHPLIQRVKYSFYATLLFLFLTNPYTIQFFQVIFPFYGNQTFAGFMLQGFFFFLLCVALFVYPRHMWFHDNRLQTPFFLHYYRPPFPTVQKLAPLHTPRLQDTSAASKEWGRFQPVRCTQNTRSAKEWEFASWNMNSSFVILYFNILCIL